MLYLQTIEIILDIVEVRLVRIEQYSGDKAIFYSVIVDGEDETLFEKFLKENIGSFKDELINIDHRIRVMNEKYGAQENYFKLHEGKLGDGVAAICDLPSKKLRLYCIRYGSTTVIIGGGGNKKSRTYQENPKLDKEVKMLSRISNMITSALKDKEIYLNENGTFSGNLLLED